MKRFTSRFLKGLAILFMAFPVVHLLFGAIVFDIPPVQWIRIMLSPLYYMVCFWAMLGGYGLWEMRRWGWYIFLVSQLLIAYENAYWLVHYAESNNKVMAFIATVVLQAALVFRIAREVRVPYFLPKIRWWESNPRYRLSVPVKITERDRTLDGEILDLSMGGCFVKLRTDLDHEEKINLSFRVYGHSIQCEGQVVWRTHSTVTHPKGVGIKFSALGKDQRRALKAVTLRLKKIAAFYRRARYLKDQDEFLRQLKELESSDSKT